MTTPTKPRPWQRHAVRTPRPDVVVAEGAPLAQITIYEDLVLLSRRSGASWRQYPIDPLTLSQVLARVPTISGLLPPHTLGTGVVLGQPFYVVYVPPRRAVLRMEKQDFTIPLPPLVWAGCGVDYRVWALGTADYPTDTRLPLNVAPFPNCYSDGRICWGTSDARPPASPKTLAKTLDLFLTDSYFNLHLVNGKSVAYPTSCVGRWQALVESTADAYPLDDLIPADCQLGWLLEGGPWAAGGRRE